MKVFKFGGASLKNAGAIRNMAGIVKSFTDKPLLVVVSAMGKTTNALESILNTSIKGGDPALEIVALKKYHDQICQDLFGSTQPVQDKLGSIFNDLSKIAKQRADYDQVYDQVVSLGEVISSIIVEQYLKSTGVQSTWVDARKFILTDRTFREGKVQWDATADRIKTLLPTLQKNVVLTQG